MTSKTKEMNTKTNVEMIFACIVMHLYMNGFTMIMDIGKRMDDKRIRILLFQCFSNYIPENQHDIGKSTMNEDVIPIEHGGFPASLLGFGGVSTIKKSLKDAMHIKANHFWRPRSLALPAQHLEADPWSMLKHPIVLEEASLLLPKNHRLTV